MRGTGLAAHVRAKHPREYGRWTRNPNRLVEADAAASRQPEARKNLPLHPVRSSASVEVAEAASPIKTQPQLSTKPVLPTGARDVPEALSLLQKAHKQLSTRKQSIESELARIEGLRSEHEALTAEVAALDQAMKAFQDQRVRHPKTA
jgi:hypothetical protein